FIEHPEWKNHPEWYVFEEYDGEQSIGGGTVGILDPCNINFSIDVEGWTEEQNQESENMLFDAIIYELRKAIDESNGLKSNIAFTLDDNYAWSKDGKSQAEMQKYGTAAGEYIHYVNKVAKKLKEFYPSIRVTIFAYNQTSIPPVKKDSKGKWVAIDNTVMLEDNVDVYLTMGAANRFYGLTDEHNQSTVDNVEMWQAVTSNFSFWTYGITYYGNYFLPSGALNSLNDTYNYLFSVGAQMVYEQGQYNQKAYTDWGTLKSYLVSKLMWDTTLSERTVIEDFFKNYFKNASKSMLELFDAEQAWLAYLYDVKKAYVGSQNEGAINNIIDKANKDNWPDALLQQFLAKIDEAYNSIEELKRTDKELYSLLYDRITLESLAFRYLRYEIYGSNYGDEKTEWCASIYNDCKRLNLTQFSELVSIETKFGQK
ncbi:MAG: DUF4838 domain-containing protein, partial [Bacilli bacterium]|nr:DUF4838 domain-containing protein [Bacilli bacterium]